MLLDKHITFQEQENSLNLQNTVPCQAISTII